MAALVSGDARIAALSPGAHAAERRANSAGAAGAQPRAMTRVACAGVTAPGALARRTTPIVGDALGAAGALPTWALALATHAGLRRFTLGVGRTNEGYNLLADGRAASIGAIRTIGVAMADESAALGRAGAEAAGLARQTMLVTLTGQALRIDDIDEAAGGHGHSNQHDQRASHRRQYYAIALDYLKTRSGAPQRRRGANELALLDSFMIGAGWLRSADVIW